LPKLEENSWGVRLLSGHRKLCIIEVSVLERGRERFNCICEHLYLTVQATILVQLATEQLLDTETKPNILFIKCKCLTECKLVNEWMGRMIIRGGWRMDRQMNRWITYKEVLDGWNRKTVK